jgi:hypothetical protein
VLQACLIVRELAEKGGSCELLCHDGAYLAHHITYVKGINAYQ